MSNQPRYTKILVPLDGSGWSQRAIPHAVDLARSNGAELILLHVFRPPASEYTDQLSLAGQDAQIQQMREQMKQYLVGLRGELRSQHMEVRAHMIEGSGVAHLICEYVSSEGIDLVVMSTHGRSGLAQFLFGSVANQIMQCVKVPVLLIHPERA
ncbi:MAG: universal stress protein [Anaerolineae bacterium]|nr:universal stress protein [Anaerolineae bacterium]